MKITKKNAEDNLSAQAWINTRGRIYWYDQYALNEQDSAFAKYDPDRITRELVGTGADIITIYAANQFSIAYYPSAIWPQHPNLKGRDYVGDLTTRLRKHGKKIIHYISWLESKHPEWNTVGIDQAPSPYPHQLASWADPARPNGRVYAIPGGQWQNPCFNSPKRDQVIAIAEEIVERYHPDGFHLDMLVHGDICVCDYCRPALEKICGTKNPTRETIYNHWQAYIDWRSERSASIFAGISAVLRKRGIIAAHNTMAPLFVTSQTCIGEEALPSMDVFLSECFDVFQAPCSDLNSTGINVRWQNALGLPSWILLTSTPVHYAHWPVTRAQWLIYASACKANGGKVFGPCGVGAHPDTTTNKHLLENVTSGLEFYMKDADLDLGAESDARIALLFSWATRKYYQADVNAIEWREEFIGWARLMIEEHLPFDIVVAERLDSPEALTKYHLLVLPNSANLSEHCCRVIREYVRDGGRMLATAEASLRDEKGARRVDFALRDVLGISSHGFSKGHFAMEQPNGPEPASGIFRKIKAAGKIISRYIEVDPAGSVVGMKDPLPGATSRDWPVVTANSFGGGRSCYIAFDIGRYFSTHGDAHIGRQMAATIDDLLPARQVMVKAPRTVEVTIWRQEALERTIIHMANRTVPWTLPTDSRQITEIIPVYDIELEMESPCSKPTISCRGTEIHHQLNGNRLKISVSRLDAYAAILIGGK